MRTLQKKNSRAELGQIKRIVIKLGSSSVLGQKQMRHSFLKDLAAQISKLGRKGIEVLLVSSGAVSLGHWQLQWPRPFNQLSVPEKQGLASVGQGILMEKFRKIFLAQKINIGQILLSAGDINRRDSYLNLRNAIETLLRANVIPVMNENDSVAVEELLFGDNDTLAANIAVLAQADALIIFSDIDGFLINGERVSWIKKINKEIISHVQSKTNVYGTGGMQTKLKASELLMKNGIKMIIMNFNSKRALLSLLENKDIGTLFFDPEEGHKWSGKKRWIALGKNPRGSIFVDDGAARQLLRKGSSLLAIGVVAVEGNFSMGDIVEIHGPGGSLGLGLSHFSSAELNKIKGKHSSEFAAILNKNTFQTVVHRNNLVLIQKEII